MINFTTKKEYTNGNIKLLTIDFVGKERKSIYYATFIQWKNEGFAVKKGEKGTPIMVVLPKKNKKTKKENGKVVFTKTVFNEDQVEKITEKKNEI